MLITFTCPHCDSELEVDASEAGARFDCPACSTEVRTPVPRVGPGTTLGNFAIERKIGSGGMGDVFLARQLSMDRRVALKVLPQALTRKPGVVERFHHEVRMSARLEHPHVVTAFEAGEDSGYLYLAMSFVDGEDLRERLRRDGVIPEKEALAYARHIADALAYAWNNYRMLHRDVKPGNIMVDRNGRARIMDLGISKSLAEGEDAELTVSGMLVGTPHYMSPEQAVAGADLDCRADIYSLGATLYHLLSGSTPFPGKTTTEVLRQIGIVPVKPLRELNSIISEPCAKLVQKMMAPNREHRHPSWEAVMVDIDRVLAGREPLLVLTDSAGEAAAERPPAAPPAPARASAAAAGAAVRLPPVAAPPTREPPVSGRTPVPGDSAEFRTPPRIDLRQRRVRWLLRYALWRVLLVAALLALAAAASVYLRRTLADLHLRERAALILNRRPPRPPPAPAPTGNPQPPPGPTPGAGPPPRPEPAPAPSPAAPAPATPGAGPAAAPATEPARPRTTLDEAGEKHLAVVMRRATDELLAGRAEGAAAALYRAAREAILAPVSTELCRAAAVATEAGREHALLLQSLTDDTGLAVTLSTRTETLRVKVVRVEGDEVVAVRLHATADTPMGQLRIGIGELSRAEELERLRRFVGKPVGDIVLALALLRDGRATAALDPISRLPALLQVSLRARAAEMAPAKPAPEAPAGGGPAKPGG